MKKYLFLVAMTIISSIANASDTTKIEQKYFESYREDRNFVSQQNHNPSFYFFQQNHSFSEIGAKGYTTKNNKSLLLQQGESNQSFSINSKSYSILSPNAKAWGTASYENNKRKNVTFNNTSDIALLYPYITADSVGGDMNAETYAFSGGYGHQIKKFSLAATIAYRAMVEYRSVDPRPKNVVSDLDFSLGASRKLSSNYRLGASINVGKYKQTSSIKNFSELGGVSQHHLTGLGTEYSRFSGTYPNTFYEGISYGGSLDFAPENKNGFYGSVGYNIFNIDKCMSDLNDIVLTSLTNSTLKFELAYLNKQNGVKIEYRQEERSGIENIFGAVSGNYYPLIASNKNYQNKQQHLSITGLLGKVGEIHSWLLLPQLSYTSTSIEHLSSNSQMAYTLLGGKLDLQYALKRKRATYVATVGASYDRNIENSSNLTTSTLRPLTDSYLELASNHFHNFHMRLRSDFPISSIKGGIFIELNLQTGNLISNSANLSIGITF